MSALLVIATLLLGQSDEARAKALYKEGETAYNLGQFETALGKYSEAYKLKALPGFLFNMAQCHRQLGQYERAAFFYGRFVDTAGARAPNLELAKSLLEEMKTKQAAQSATPPVAEPLPPKKDELKEPGVDEQLAQEKAREELKAAQLTPTEPAPQPVVPLAPVAVVQDEPVYQKGWFWGVVAGVVVIAAGTATGVAIATAPKPKTPTLGPDLK